MPSNYLHSMSKIFDFIRSELARVTKASALVIVSGYYQEIPQLQTVDKPVTSWGRATQQSRDTRKQTKQSNQLSLPHRDDCKTRMDTKQHTTKQRATTESYNGSNNQQWITNNRTTALEWTAAKATGGLNAFYWYQIFALDSAVVEAQKILSSHGGFLTIATYHHREMIDSN